MFSYGTRLSMFKHRGREKTPSKLLLYSTHEALVPTVAVRPDYPVTTERRNNTNDKVAYAITNLQKHQQDSKQQAMSYLCTRDTASPIDHILESPAEECIPRHSTVHGPGLTWQ